MSRIEQAFKRTRRERRSALIPFITAGDPDLQTTEALVLRMAESGADMIEMGIPFSDPLADGRTLQAASQRALQNGVNLSDIFRMTERLKGIATPLVIMSYFNPVLRYGVRPFVEDCKKSGIDGVIIPDLPFEEAEPWVNAARESDLDTIFLATPTSPPNRIRTISRLSRGFIYYVSVKGLTGARAKLPEDLELAVRRIKEQTQKPVAVGFGISTPEQVREVSRFADGVIVGSAIVKIIEENLNRPDSIPKVVDFVSSLAKVLKA